MMKLYKLLILSVLVLFFAVSCEDSSTAADYVLSITADTDTLYNPDGQVSCDLEILLTKNGTPYEDAEIELSTNLGSVPANVETNENGEAEFTFNFSGSGSGEVTIQAAYEDAYAEYVLHLIEGYPFELTLSAGIDTLFIGTGTTAFSVEALLTRQSEPVADAVLSCSSYAGDNIIEDIQVTTNEQGIAEINLQYTVAEETEIHIEATYGGYTAELFIPAVTDPALQLALTTSSNIIYLQSSVNSCQITAELTAEGVALADRKVNFSASTGEVFDFDITDNDGLAQTAFWYEGDTAGEAVITAEYYGLERSIQILLVNDAPYTLEVEADPDTIILDSGNYDAVVRAQLTDENGLPLAGEVIDFTASAGSILSGSITDSQGIAEVSYTFAGTQEMNVLISAEYGEAIAVCYIHVVEAEIILTCWADPEVIYMGTSQNFCEIYAQLRNQFGAPLADEQINFTCDTGSIIGFAITNSQGIANSTFWYDERPDIVATITASYAEQTAVTSVTILTDQPQIVYLEAEPLVIYADNDTLTYSTITTQVTNFDGTPAADLEVTFETTLGYLQNTTALTNSMGYASAILHDNGIDGVATIYVNCENDQSQIDVTIIPED